MMELMILADETANAATVVNEFEELLLRIFVVTIMFGLGAGLTQGFRVSSQATMGTRHRVGHSVRHHAFGHLPAYHLGSASLLID